MLVYGLSLHPGPVFLDVLLTFSGNLFPLCLKADQPLAFFILKPERAVCFSLVFCPVPHARLRHRLHLRAADPAEALMCLPWAKPGSLSAGVQPTLGTEHPRRGVQRAVFSVTLAADIFLAFCRDTRWKGLPALWKYRL